MTSTSAGPGMRFALASLATWRVTHLLAEEDGPANVVVRLRERAGDGSLGELMDCFYCLSVWVAAPFGFALARRPRDAPLHSLALSGAACLLEQATRERAGADVLVEPLPPTPNRVADRSRGMPPTGAEPTLQTDGFLEPRWARGRHGSGTLEPSWFIEWPCYVTLGDDSHRACRRRDRRADLDRA